MRKLEDIKVKKLRAFIEVAEGRNPLLLLNVKERAVSRYIAELENICGTPLFEGWRIPSNLTASGKKMLQSAKVIVKEIDNLYIKLNK